MTTPRITPVTSMCVIGPSVLVHQRLSELLDDWLTPASRVVDYHVFRWGECSLAEILDCVRLMPMAGAHRVVVVHGIEQWSVEEAQQLAAYLATPAPSGRLVLVAEASLPAPVRQRLADHLTIETLALETRQDRVAWVREQFAAHGQSLAPEAVALLEQLVTDDAESSEIEQRLEQLSIYAGERPVISRAMVEQLAHPVTPSTVFALADATGCGEVGEALRLVATHAADPYRMPEVVGLLGWHWRRLWVARRQLDAGVPPQQIARALRVPWSAQERWGAQVRRWHQPALQRAARLLLQADARLKRGGDPRLVLELVVVTLAALPDASSSGIFSAPQYSGAESL